MIKKIWQWLILLRDYISGDFAYQNYLKHHPSEKTLDKKSFLRNKEKNRWDKINRCC
jgi:uncharacterized short protein YbdD (DUF466 family)